MQLPQFQARPDNVDTVLSQMQTAWGTIINAFISRPQNRSNILPDIDLAIGSNTIQHTLGHKLQGWSIVRIDGAASIYDQQDTNTSADKTLILVSNAAVTVSLEVF